MTIRIALLALGAMLAGNAFAAGTFSVYFPGSTSCTSASNANSAALSNGTGGSNNPGNAGDMVISGQLNFAGCGSTGGKQLTFGPAQPLQGPGTIASGSNVTGNFSVLPLNATSCTVAFSPTSNVSGPASGYVCGASGSQTCASTTPISFSANFTNTGTSATTWQATVNCAAAAGASPASLASNTVTVTQNGNSGGTPTANFTCTQTSSLTLSCTDQSTDSGGTIGSWSWTFGDGSTSTQQNPSHAYASANTYTVSLTVADSVNPTNKNTATQSIQVTTGGATACTQGQTGDISGYTAVCTGSYKFYQGTGKPVTMGPNSYTFDFVMGSAWPGAYYADSQQFSLATKQFLSIPFVASPAKTVVLGWNQSYMGGIYNNEMMSVSTQPGLFNNGQANGTTVLCAQAYSPSLTLTSSGNSSAQCKLNTTTTYWLNIVPGSAATGSFVGCATAPCYATVALTGQAN